MILLIDNYDSFSYNLYQLIGEIDPEIKVIRNDEMTTEEIRELKPDHIILSPGPGRPENAGVIIDVVKEIHDIPILGVCLGHQAICAAFGAEVTYAKKLMHGKQSDVKFDRDCPLFHSSGGCGHTSGRIKNNRHHHRRRGDGGTAFELSCLRSAVSSRVDHDAGRKKDA